MIKTLPDTFDVRFGRHSRVPDCCIAFFISEWEYMYSSRGHDEFMHSAYSRAIDAANAGYVLCPSCLGNGKRAKLRICVNECGGDHLADFK